MSQGAELLKIAGNEVGYKEGPNNQTKYGKWYGMDNNPWCMMFISWCAKEAGIPESIIPKMAYVPYAVDFFQKRGLYHSKSGYTPSPGDLIFFGSSSHVGIVEKVQGAQLVTVEGNTSAGGNSSNGDGVYRKTRSLKDSWIMGYGSPEYEGEDMEKITLKIQNLDSKKMVEVEAVYGDGTNYVKLRDVEKLFPVVVDWDGKNPTIKLNYK